MAHVTVDVVEVRSRFIQENLRRALTSADPRMAWMTASEFRRYFCWVADTLPEEDRQIITGQLTQLEELTVLPQHSRNRVSVHSDRIGHQLEEAAFA
jgi:hypothetical protein